MASASSSGKPDVEEIVSQIRQDVADAAEAVPQGARDVVTSDDDLQTSLAAMNERCLVGRKGTGIMGLLNKARYKPLAKLIAEINGFNASVVRVLNGQMRVLEGKDETIGSELLDKQQRRIDLLQKLEERVAVLEEKLSETDGAKKS